MSKWKSDYAAKLKDPRWQKRRLDIMQRDEFKCRDCDVTDKTLHVHHCLYRNDAEPWEYRDDELRTLCEKCHESRASIEHDVKLEFGRALAGLTQDQLSEVMCSILDTKKRGVETGIAVIDGLEFKYHSEFKWWMEAEKSKSFRSAFDRISETATKWDEVDEFKRKDKP